LPADYHVDTLESVDLDALRVTCCLGMVAACGCDHGRDGFTDGEWDVIETLSPLPDVAFDPALAPLGQTLYFETGFAGPLAVGDDGQNGGLGAVGETGKISCASCHMPDAWFVDRRSRPNQTSLGAAWTLRNAPTVVNAIYHTTFPWHGKFATIADLMKAPLTGPTLMNGSKLGIAQVMWEEHFAEYVAAFGEAPPDTSAGDPPEAELDVVLANVSLALEHYQRLLVSRNAPFDRYVAGDEAAISDSAKRGLGLFIGDALCIECHSGPRFSDDDFYDTGVPQTGDHVPADDPGRGDVMGYEDQVGKFRTPGLRTVAQTAPYMHTGALATLDEVVEYYWRGGGEGAEDHPAIAPLDLTADDMRDLVAFLETLTGEPIAESLRTPPAGF
jgi:cytochrome c peroxidase